MKISLSKNTGWIKLAIDLALASATAWGAFAMRLGLPIPILYRRSELIYIFLSLAVKIAVGLAFKLYKQSWRNIGVRDLTTIGRAVITFAMLMATISFLLGGYYRIPRSIPLIDALLLLTAWGGARLAVRLFSEGSVRKLGGGSNNRVLVVGAGEAGTMIVREMLRHPESRLIPVGFLDDDPGKRNATFLGYPVFGPVDQLGSVARSQGVDEILIAIPSVQGDAIRSILETAHRVKVPARIIPGIWEVLSGKVNISSIRNVEVEDLLNRDPVRLDLDAIAGYIRGKTILITGAGGSIGSEIVRQILPFGSRHVILLGRGRTASSRSSRNSGTSITSATSPPPGVRRNRERLRRPRSPSPGGLSRGGPQARPPHGGEPRRPSE
ncbi:hypothetical protein MASR2M79_11960 [Aminivibrio sp.]